jgi:hypothetical protein
VRAALQPQALTVTRAETHVMQVMDAFDMAAVLRLQSKIGRQFNKVFIDINGSRDIGTVCDCMDKYQKVTLKFSTPWQCACRVIQA